MILGQCMSQKLQWRFHGPHPAAAKSWLLHPAQFWGTLCHNHFSCFLDMLAKKFGQSGVQAKSWYYMCKWRFHSRAIWQMQSCYCFQELSNPKGYAYRVFSALWELIWWHFTAIKQKKFPFPAPSLPITWKTKREICLLCWCSGYLI